MVTIADDLLHLAGTCSTYVITRDGGGLVIDCGAQPLDAVHAAAGIAVERCLLTHFHRDQCSVAAAWVAAGVEVTVPFAEKRFYEEADLLRASYDTFDSYTAYYPGFSCLEDVAATYAVDYEAVSWQDMALQVVPLPGHSFGSTGYLFELDGVRYLACGDLMSAPGKMHEYHRSQWLYMSFQGHVNHIESLATVQRLRPDVILPGHGQPFAFTDAAIDSLQGPLEELYSLFHGQPYQAYEPVFRQLSGHVYEVTNSGANSYIVRDDDGHGLFIDCGYTSGAPIAANPHRFIDHLTPWLAEETGVTDVEWFICSHYHDDHLAGLPALQARYGTRVASSPELQDILEHPERYDMPCLVPHATVVDRVVDRDEVFAWRGIDIRIEQHPGQTWYHHLISFEVDDKRYLATGDNISGLCFREQRDFIHSFIPKNRTPVTSYSDMPRQIRERAPDVLLTGHGGAVDCDAAQVDRWQTWMDRWQELFTGIIDRPHPNLGMDPQWVEFYPYKTRVRPGDEITYEIRIRNHESEVRAAVIDLRGSGGVQLSTARFELEVPPGDSSFRVTVSFPQTRDVHAWTIVADVTWDGVTLGEIAEAIAYW